jgi:predicted aspartyl protease
MNVDFGRVFLLVLLTFESYVGTGRTIIPIEINDGGYIFVNVTLNGNIDAKFMLDTGAGVNVISKELFEKIRTTLKEEGLHTGTRHNGEQITSMLYSVPELSIGSFSKQNVALGIYHGLKDFRRTSFTGLLQRVTVHN